MCRPEDSSSQANHQFFLIDVPLSLFWARLPAGCVARGGGEGGGTGDGSDTCSGTGSGTGSDTGSDTGTGCKRGGAGSGCHRERGDHPVDVPFAICETDEVEQRCTDRLVLVIKRY